MVFNFISQLSYRLNCANALRRRRLKRGLFTRALKLPTLSKEPHHSVAYHDARLWAPLKWRVKNSSREPNGISTKWQKFKDRNSRFKYYPCPFYPTP